METCKVDVWWENCNSRSTFSLNINSTSVQRNLFSSSKRVCVCVRELIARAETASTLFHVTAVRQQRADGQLTARGKGLVCDKNEAYLCFLASKSACPIGVIVRIYYSVRTIQRPRANNNWHDSASNLIGQYVTTPTNLHVIRLRCVKYIVMVVCLVLETEDS